MDVIITEANGGHHISINGDTSPLIDITLEAMNAVYDGATARMAGDQIAENDAENRLAYALLQSGKGPSA